MMRLETEIQEFAHHLGFCACGFTSAEDLKRGVPEAIARGGYENWLDWFREKSHPRGMYPEGKSILVLAYDYARCAFPEKLLPFIGRVYLSRSYSPQPGSPVYAMLRSFEDFLRQKGIGFSDNPDALLLRPAAERAGVSSFGRNNFAYVDGVGSFVVLYGYVVDRQLEAGEPARACQCPPNCHACVDACPTKALYAPFQLDPGKCIGYNNWARTEERQNAVVPRALRPLMGCHVHGCDLCQEACPRNRLKLRQTYDPDPQLERIAEEFSLSKLLHMPQGFYDSCLKPILYNYIRDPVYFQRNAAIAMGNTHDPAYVPDLIQELDHPREMVRVHVAWALGQIGGEEAWQALRKREKAETSPAVLEEIRLSKTSR